MRAAPFCLLLVLAAGCHTTQRITPQMAGTPPRHQKLDQITFTNRVEATWLTAPTEPFTLGPGDKLELELLGEPTSKVTTVVGPDGKIYFNLLPGIDVWGLTLAQAKEELEKGLAKYMREPPQVTIVLRGVESRRIWILGRVQAPGVYPMPAPMTLLEAISLAGGTLNLSSFRQEEATGATGELADLKRSFVLRHGKRLPVDFARLLQAGDLSQNIYLQPDDFVYLPTANAQKVYVLGAVTEPRAVPFREGLTVAGAVSSAYGTITGAYLQHVAVLRGSLSEPQMAVVDYKNVIRGQAQDMALQPGDIVYVPFSPFRYLTHYAQLIVDTFVSSAAINAGSAAVPQRAITGAGIFIPVGSGIQVIPPISPPPIR